MFLKLYRAFIEPQQKDEDSRNRELVLNVLLVGTLCILTLALLVLIHSYFTNYRYVLPRIEGLAGALVLTWWTYFLSRSGKHRLAAWLLIIMYIALATAVAAKWSVAMPYAVALFALVVMVTSAVTGSKATPYVTALCIVIIVVVKGLQQTGRLHPDLAWAQSPLDSGVIGGFSLIFAIIALVSWLFNEQTERSLHRAHRAEAGLRRQKMLLESKVEERTRELQVAQLDKIQQLYRFAELGQLSTALLHDLANHLTTLTIDIEGLESESHSRVLKSAKRSIRYIDDMVLRVRDQLQGKAHIAQFNIASETEEIMSILTHKAAEAGVPLSFEMMSDRQEFRCRGEQVRFRQMMANMITNGVDAYDGAPKGNRREVRVTLEVAGDSIVVTITDWGKGITKEVREKLFEPFYSTKKTGMGMGLFIARQIIEQNFRGSLVLDDSLGHTSFIMTIKRDTKA